LRFGREKVPLITTDRTPFTVGRADIYREGKDVAIVACGIMVYEALIAAEELRKQGTEALVVNNHTIKPIDRGTLIDVAGRTGAVVTAEEHQIYGGLGSAVAEVLSEHCPVPMEYVAVRDHFGESGQPHELLEKIGLKSTDIIRAVQKVLKKKK
jgi:transketolase